MEAQLHTRASCLSRGGLRGVFDQDFQSLHSGLIARLRQKAGAREGEARGRKVTLLPINGGDGGDVI